jgi:UDP-glucose 4-epimerase
MKVAHLLRVLITGASGFIGRNLAELFLGRYRVESPSSCELDLVNEQAVREYLTKNRFDVVVHCATTRSNRKVGAPADLLDRNCRMFFNLLRNKSSFGKLIYFGSGAEYDRHELPALVPEGYFDTRIPMDPYGFSKYLCAKYAETQDQTFNLRLFGVFGKYEPWDVRFIANACARVVCGLPIVIRQDVVFDYLYVKDLADIAAKFIESTPKQRTYNVCTGRGCKLSNLARIVARESGRSPEIRVIRSGFAPEYTGNNSRLMTEFGAFNFRPLSESIRELYSWYEDQKERQLIDPELLRFDG